MYRLAQVICCASLDFGKSLVHEILDQLMGWSPIVQDVKTDWKIEFFGDFMVSGVLLTPTNRLPGIYLSSLWAWRFDSHFD